MLTHADLLTPADWQRRLDAGRSSATGSSPDSADDLRDTFRAITRRTRALFQRPALLRTSNPALAEFVRDTLSCSRLLATELERQDPAPIEITRELATRNQDSLDRLEGLCAWTDFTTEMREALEPLLSDLAFDLAPSVRPLLLLAEDLSAAFQTLPARLDLIPIAGVSPRVLHPQDRRERVEVFLQAALSARLLHSHAREVLSVETSDLRTLLAAALVQDVGAWPNLQRSDAEPLRVTGNKFQKYGFHKQHALADLTGPHRSMTAPRSATSIGTRRLDPNHPATGAAMLAGADAGPVSLGLLVGLHHERLDGSGYPRRLSRGRLDTTEQFFALIIRFSELLLDDVTAELARNQQMRTQVVAGSRLWREVRREAFDEGLARAFFQAIEPGFVEILEARYAERERHLVDANHAIPAPRAWSHEERSIEVAAPVIEAPAFLRRPRSARRADPWVGSIEVRGA